MDFVFLSRKKLLIILESQILPFKEIFKKKIFRIPDYQRGYSWEQTQLEDLWADLSNIHLHAYHFTGILTINNFSEQDYESSKGKCHDDDGLSLDIPPLKPMLWQFR